MTSRDEIIEICRELSQEKERKSKNKDKMKQLLDEQSLKHTSFSDRKNTKKIYGIDLF